jgi:alpha-glucuronidase
MAISTTGLLAYDGSKTWLNYSPVPDGLKAGYSAACVNLVISNPESDTLKNAKSELDLGITGLLGKTLTVSTAATAGAIVLAPEGSPLVASAGIDYSAINKEGFIIKSAGNITYISGKTEVGVLRGVFSFLRLMQTGKSISNLDIKENPYFAFRVLDHWWNHFGSNPTVERVYGGDRVYKMENFGSLNTEGAARTAVINYCRMAASLGLNGITPDGVNTVTMNSLNWQCLQEDKLKDMKLFADILGTWGLRPFLSISYDSPKRVGGLTSSDPTKQDVKDWWKARVTMVYKYMPNFGGFLIKSDSEDEAGPLSLFNSNQAEGSKPIAEALDAHGGVVIWRTFIYTKSKQDDFAITQEETFTKAGMTWNKNVILRMKDGPRDFQVVEPPNFLTTIGGVRLGMEFEVTQEYTGQDKHVCWLVPRWKQVLDWNMVGANIRTGVQGTKVAQILSGDNTWENGGGMWGISNLSNATNWTGHYLHQANAYGFGRLAWNPNLSADQIADEWIRCSFATGGQSDVQYIVGDILKKSWKAYEDYTISYSALMPAVGANLHYEIDFDNMDGAGFLTPFFMNLTSDGIGVDRTAKSSKFLTYLPKALADSLGNIASCPEDYLLFFQHCKWEYKMKSGMTLIQSLQYNHFRGIRQVKRFINNWNLLDGKIDAEIHKHVADKLKIQLTDASRWANIFRSQFKSRYSTAVGCDLEITTPTVDKAATVASNGSVALSARFADQNGKAITETINWTVSNGGTLSAATGQSVNFSAAADGIYMVTASTATYPDLKDQLQIFVGDWSGKTGVHKNAPEKITGNKMILNQLSNMMVISVPFTGKLDIVGLNGRSVKSISVPKAGAVKLNTEILGKGLYLICLHGKQQDIRNRVFIR